MMAIDNGLYCVHPTFPPLFKIHYLPRQLQEVLCTVMVTKTFACSTRYCTYSTDLFTDYKRHSRLCKYNKKQRLQQNMTVAIPSNHQQHPHPSDALHDLLHGENNTYTDSEPTMSVPTDTSHRSVQIGKVQVAANHLLALSEGIGFDAVRKVIRLLQETTFKPEVVSNHIQDYKTWMSIVQSSLGQSLSDDGFEKIEVPYNNCSDNNRKAFLYKKNVIEVLRTQLKISGDKDITFRPCFNEMNRDFVSHPLQSEFFATLYKSVRTEIMSSEEASIEWNQSRSTTPNSFIGMLQIYTDKTATTLKSQSLVGYPIHVTFLNVTIQFRRFLIDHGYTLVGFLPVGFQDAQSDSDADNLTFHNESKTDDIIDINDHVPLTSSSRGRNDKMCSLHNAMTMILAPLIEKSYEGFTVCTKKNITWNCFPVIVSYCCDIPESKDMSGVLHNFTPTRPCVRCLGTSSQFMKGTRTVPRTMHYVKER